VNTEAVVYIARKLHWTRSEIGKLSPVQFNEILKELYYQESVDEWRKMHTVASILAAIYNTIPRKSRKALTAKDFLNGNMPTREEKREEKRPEISMDILAKQKGIILPRS